jgi:peptide/nickel transport system substrate-binding protein
VELDKDKRIALVHEMLTRFQQSAVYDVFASTPDLEAYRTDRFEGWVRQPAKVGPVIFSNTSPTYRNLKPIAASSSGGGGTSTGAIVGIGVAAVALVALAAWFLMRRRSADERE